VTQYTPQVATAGILSLGPETYSATISNVHVTGFDMVRGSSALFEIKAYGSVTFENCSFTDINKIAYSYDTTDFNYVSNTGGIFNFEQYGYELDVEDLTHNFNNITMNGIYGQTGVAFYLIGKTGITSFHSTSIILNTVTIKNSFSSETGQVALLSGNFVFHMLSCIFQSNS
jgi:hypothetical protein